MHESPAPAARRKSLPRSTAAAAGDAPAAARPAAVPAIKLSGPQRAMRKLGLLRDVDLALHLPMRYIDETQLAPIASLRDGDTAQVEGSVHECRVDSRLRRQLVVRLADASGELTLRLLNFYPSHQKTLAVGQTVRARGEVRVGYLGREMVHPEFRAVSAEPGASPLPLTLTPVYPASAQLPQPYLRKAVAGALARAPLAEVLPADALPPGLPALRDALLLLHEPPRGVVQATLEDHSHPAWQRLKYDELLAQQLSQAQAHAARARLAAPVLQPRAGGLAAQLLAQLPFALTTAQQRVVDEIGADIALPQPMHRLLQGDVGCGKTVVGALAAAVAIDSGWQCALMAPTELLAEQHFRKLVGWLQPLGVTVAWLTGSRKGKPRAAMAAQVASGAAMLVVGTHAVIQQDVQFARLGLAIVDEQHRFGVAQRLALRAKLGAQSEELAGLGAQQPADMAELRAHVAGRAKLALQAADMTEPGPPLDQPTPDLPCDDKAKAQARSAQRGAPIALEPHLLMMSATPIPRTLAMTYYADLAVSTIDQLPPGRTPVVTKVFAEGKRTAVIQRIVRELATLPAAGKQGDRGAQATQGKQVYWVCPLVEDSEHLDLQNATATHAELSAVLAQALPGAAVGLLHGRMAAADKAAVMAEFSAGCLQVLVATTVIEVGVDVPNASLMVIEHAERFGLAQLHQLRGRVGRGAAASVCVLLYSPPLSATGRARLQAMVETSDGFEIARRDLDIRGPGEFMGARQSGDTLLRFADLAEDSALLQHARAVAPRLLAEHPQAAAAHVARWLGARQEFLKA